MHQRAAALARWGLAFAGFFLLSALAYGLSPSNQGLPAALTWLLWPGIALYIQLNGSLIFGSGFGTAGDFLIIVLGSALAWSGAVAALEGVWGRICRSRRR